MNSVLQDWVMELGLRHQGALLSVVRGCDTVGKDDVTKHLVRQIRGLILNAHCGDNAKAKTFIDAYDTATFEILSYKFFKNMDNYPFHYMMHLLHSVEIIGFYHPDTVIISDMLRFYRTFCHKMHVNPETMSELNRRLNANEETFAANASCSGKL